MDELDEIPAQNRCDVLIAGGGLAGLTASIILARAGHRVILVEKNDYPKHKVCGEYISNEVRPLLESLKLFPEKLKPTEIARFACSNVHGKVVETSLELGGFGISRYAFDHFLYDEALKAGVEVRVNTEVREIRYQKHNFIVSTSPKNLLRARVVIGAHGKRSVIDKRMNRSFIENTTSYVAVKQHFHAQLPTDLVSLHNFKGGYAGLSVVENAKVNLCYLTTKTQISRYSDLEEFSRFHLTMNPHLATFLEGASAIMERPLVISQVNFSRKPVIEDHVLMCGDAAGLIHPLCGNGMAMAIHAAALCSGYVKDYLGNKIDRESMERHYQTSWHAVFGKRLAFGNLSSRLFGKDWLTDLSLQLARRFPGLLHNTVRMSHGNYVHINDPVYD